MTRYTVALLIWPCLLSAQPDLGMLAERFARESFDDFKAFLAIPCDAHYLQDILENVSWAEKAFAQRRFATRRLDTGTPIPLLLGERQSKVPGAATVLVYLQLDGQPVDPEYWYQESPWLAVLKEQREGEGWMEIPWESLVGPLNPDWRFFARASADAKGPVMMFLSALDAIDFLGVEPNYHLKVIMDFEEELGSPNLPGAVSQHRETLMADALVIFDGPMHISNRPTLAFGARGMIDLTLTVHGPLLPPHSGHYGNYCPNPALRLSQLLSSMKDNEGRVIIDGFYDGIDLTQETRQMLALVPDDEQALRVKLGIGSVDQVGANLQEALQYPSLNIRGLRSAWVGDERRTIIPSSAVAELDIRLVLESDPDRLIQVVKDHIEEQGYLILDRRPTMHERLLHAKICELQARTAYLAYRTEMDSPVGSWLADAVRSTFGQDPVMIRTMGGSIPISPFVTELGVPAVSVPTVNADNNQHSPNENLRLGNYIDGIKTMIAVLVQPWR